MIVQTRSTTKQRSVLKKESRIYRKILSKVQDYPSHIYMTFRSKKIIFKW